MPVITLTTDLGTRDYYVAAVKGTILSICPEAILVDVSHDIVPFDLFQAAFVIKNAYHHFPPGSIHIIGVDVSGRTSVKALAAQYNGHYFLASDNGIFSMLFDDTPEVVTAIQFGAELQVVPFPLRDILAVAAGQLAIHRNIELFGPRVQTYLERNTFNPVVTNSEIRGQVVYIDGYGNAITNVTKSLFYRVGESREFALYFTSMNQPIRKISMYYDDVAEGERLALFTSSGHLQISINKGINGAGGGASQLFGLKLHSSIRIEFL
ncbi:MAG TPA: SAM-dependent chlorinase/fluorinase [Luteibaculaceae bacterium]|nr:SAM-dependent chlorinase/fluorinase [Luteibaculaceae bacterium]